MSVGEWQSLAAVAAAGDALLRAAILATIQVESRGNPRAVGSSGERGLGQIMAATAQLYGYRGTLAGLHDPATNIGLTARILRDLLGRFGGRLDYVASSYNCGYLGSPARPRCLRSGGALANASYVRGWIAALKQWGSEPRVQRQGACPPGQRIFAGRCVHDIGFSREITVSAGAPRGSTPWWLLAVVLGVGVVGYALTGD